MMRLTELKPKGKILRLLRVDQWDVKLRHTNKSCHLSSSPSYRVHHVRLCPCIQHHPGDLSLPCRHRRRVTTPPKNNRFFHHTTVMTNLTGQQTSALCIRAHAGYSSHLRRAAAATCTCLPFLCKRRAWEGTSRTVEETKWLRKAASLYIKKSPPQKRTKHLNTYREKCLFLVSLFTFTSCYRYSKAENHELNRISLLWSPSESWLVLHMCYWTKGALLSNSSSRALLNTKKP